MRGFTISLVLATALLSADSNEADAAAAINDRTGGLAEPLGVVTPVDVAKKAPIDGVDATVGVAKSVSVSGSGLLYTFNVKNYGNAMALEISIPDTLDSVLGPDTYVVAGLTKLSGLATFSVDSAFLGTLGASELIAPSSSLGPGEQAVIELAVTVAELTDQGHGLGAYSNTVFSAAEGPSTTGTSPSSPTPSSARPSRRR